jgi:phosphoribosylformylglycinamidine synthase
MGGKGGVGIELQLDKVPMREEGMTPYEIMLSESQERMLMILKPEKTDLARKIFEKWELAFATIGTITDTGNIVLKWHGETVADMPIAPVSTDAPVYDRPFVPTPKRSAVTLQDSDVVNRKAADDLLKLLGSPDLCSKRWIYEQYDSMVGNDTVAGPGGDAAIVRVHGTNKALAITTDCTPRYCFADPHEGGKQAVAETWRNLTATGATPLAITNCLNFGNPEKPETMGQLVGCLQGMTEACKELDYPVISGNVSLYNETNGKGIFPTPAIGGVGILKDVSKAIGNSFGKEGLDIILIGKTEGHLGSSLALSELFGREDGPPPPVNLKEERKNGDFVRQLITTGTISACHDVSDGGLMVALAEMTYRGGIGAHVTIPVPMNQPAKVFGYLLGEDQGRYIVATDPANTKNILSQAEKLGVAVTKLGKTLKETLEIEDVLSLPVTTLKQSHEKWLPSYMGS